MRIRKRKVPLPLSLLSPVPLSDPHLFGRSPVIVQPYTDNILDTNTSQPSDRVDPTSSMTSASDLRRLIALGVEKNHSTITPLPTQLESLKPCLSFEENERKDIIDGRGDVVELSNAMGAKLRDDHTNIPISSEEKNPILVKKKRSRDSNFGATTTTVGPTLEAEPNNAPEEERKDDIALEGGRKGGGGGSKVKRGNTIMEGSRCSRVNGRGWRCCQPTLVGYSLCEHHLGKGRLRSMTGVRGRPLLFKKEAAVADESGPQPSPTEAKGGPTASSGTTQQTPVMVNSSVGKRVKLGVVKARSLSSLLGQNPSASSDCHEQMEVNMISKEINANDGNQVVNEGV